jgi:hypothetical protein
LFSSSSPSPFYSLSLSLSEHGHIEEVTLGLARLHGGEKKRGKKTHAADPVD